MNIKRHYGLWLATISLVSGVLVASLQLEQEFLPAPDDFTPLNLLRWILIFSGISFVSLLLLIFLAILGRNFLRWLFSWRILKRCLLALVFFLALIPIFYAEEDWRGKHAWEKFKQEWEAHGEKFDFASFIPPPVPDEQNFAFAPIVASAYGRVMDKSGHRIEPENTNVVNRLDLDLYRKSPLVSSNLIPLGWRAGRFTDLPAWQDYYRTMFVTNHHPAGMEMSVNPYRPPDLPASPTSRAITSFPNPQDTNDVLDVEALNTNEFPFAAQPQSPAADVLLALSKFNGVIEELRQAAQRPQSRFPLDYGADFPAQILVPHYAGLRNCVSVLSLRASAELAAEPPAALADIKLMLRLIESIRSEPSYFAQSTRTGWFNYVMQPIWEGVVRHKWTDGQLAELDAALAGLDFLADYVAGVRAECAADVQAVEWCRITSNRGILPMGSDDEKIDFRERLELWYFYAFPNGWYDLGKKAVCQAHIQGELSAADLQRRVLSPDKYVISMISVEAALNSRKPWDFWTHFFLPAIRPLQFAEAQTEVDLTRVAIALERYRLAHDEYTETLGALSPQYLGNIPNDVINGQPLRYRRTDGGKFLLYSVGWNQADDGGIFGTNNMGRPLRTKGDWVWMLPKD